MTGRRSSARIAAQSQNAPPLPPPKAAPASKKRKNEASGSSPTSKRGKKDDQLKQITLEETIQNGQVDQPRPDDIQDTAGDRTSDAALNGSKPEATIANEAKEGASNVEPADVKPTEENVVKMSGTEEPKPDEPRQDPVEAAAAQHSTGQAQEPEGKEVEAEEAKAAEAHAAEPTAAEPTAAEPTAAEPTAAEPTAAEPKAAEQAVQPEATGPEAEKPKVEVSRHEAPDADAARRHEPTTHSPKTAHVDEPKHEDHKASHQMNGERPAEQTKAPDTNGEAVLAQARSSDEVASSILEKGVVYFFFRARVNVDDPQDVKDIARTYIVLRPMPTDAKLGDGPIGDHGNCRLLALPKKVLPRSGKDRFLTFVEKAKTSFADLKESFLPGSDYATKTAGTSHTPAATPLAEGVYAITSTGRESHLSYMITIPQELGQVQKDLGLKEKGSFVTSVRNPTASGPSNTNLPHGPQYPQDILDEFRDLRWKPLEPKYLDYVNTQFLLIGESFDTAMEQRPKDEREGYVAPAQELEKLEGEDEIRVKHLHADDTVFADLGISSKEFPRVPTTW